jgi:succinyl-CoA synthetase (ADP-forming) beta subunit (EC 6.2.1.5)
MKIHEYQAKEIFAAFGIPVPRERIATNPAEAASRARELGLPVVMKAQVLVGGRGKAGGVKRVDHADQVEAVASSIIGMDIKGLKVNKVLVSECVDIKGEAYVGIIIDLATRAPVLMASAAGGVEIEEVAKATLRRSSRSPSTRPRAAQLPGAEHRHGAVWRCKAGPGIRRYRAEALPHLRPEGLLACRN